MAVMPYLMQLTPQAFAQLRTPLSAFTHFSADIVLHVLVPFTSLAPNA